jgi:hypothetical protein
MKEARQLRAREERAALFFVEERWEEERVMASLRENLRGRQGVLFAPASVLQSCAGQLAGCERVRGVGKRKVGKVDEDDTGEAEGNGRVPMEGVGMR